MRQTKFLFMLVLGILALILLPGCSDKEVSNGAQGGKLQVYTSIYPLYDFTSKLGGDKIEVHNIVPPGGEPHEWEPSPRDIANISKADVLIYCGTGIETWIEKILPSLDPSKVIVVDASKGIPVLDLEAKEEKGHEHGEHDHSTDPHIWVDPINAKAMVDNIQQGLKKADPSNEQYYKEKAATFQGQLDDLHREYQTALAGAKGKEFIVSHAAFGYLAQRYGLTQVPIRGLSPEVEPSPNDMAQIVKVAREKGIKYIFTETMVSPKVSEALAQEVSAEILVLNPMGGLTQEEIAAGHDYLTIMRENLKNLKLALGVSI